MAQSRIARVDSFMRLTHSYTGLFLIPWLLVYAGSAFCLNHGPWINKTFKITPPQWQVKKKVEFAPDNTFPELPAAQAKVIMQHLNMKGAHRVLPKAPPNRMIILRPSGGGNYRITWQRQKDLLIVERQPFSPYRLMHFLHFRGSYRQKDFAHVAWAVIVDIVSISLCLWIISGVYIWFRRRRQRLAGGICLGAGCILFAVLVAMLCL
jgi:hypothetical protein